MSNVFLSSSRSSDTPHETLVRLCNECLRPSQDRVEVRTDTQRSMVCASCCAKLGSEAAKSGGKFVVLGALRDENYPECSICRSRHPNDDRHVCE